MVSLGALDISICPLPIAVLGGAGNVERRLRVVTRDLAETLQEAVVRGPDSVLLRNQTANARGGDQFRCPENATEQEADDDQRDSDLDECEPLCLP